MGRIKSSKFLDQSSKLKKLELDLEMRLNFLLLNGIQLILSQKCHEMNEKARKKTEELKMDATMAQFECVRAKTLDQWSSTNEDTQQRLIAMMLKTADYGKLDAEFCHRIKNNYAPFGLDEYKPDRLKCDVIEHDKFDCPEEEHYNPECEEKGEKVNLQEPVYEIEGVRVPNIVILGQTGAGKSYFSNGLMGYRFPDKGPFGTGDKSVSCT